MIITIDGPSGSGKSTIAQEIGKRFGFFVLNTGFLYRAYAVAALAANSNNRPEKSSEDIVASVLHHAITYSYDSKTNQTTVFYDTHNVTPLLKTAAVDQAASLLSKNRLIRDAVNQQARALAVNKNIVAEGRDCGTVVFPHAEVKLFLTASEEVRAQRIAQDATRSLGLSVQEIQRAIHERDTRDANRLHAPLKNADDAVVIDTSEQSIDAIIQTISKLIQQ